MIEKRSLSTEIWVYESKNNLPAKDAEMLDIASKAARRAHALYSGFHVGAALLLDDGTIIEGNNQENAAYPSGLCAERVALFYASATFPQKKIKAIAITAYSAKEPVTWPVSPCGACRQVMAEYESKHGSPIRIIMHGETGEAFVADSVSDLLPLMFDKKSLAGKK